MRKTRLLVTLGTIVILVAGLLLAAGCNGDGEEGGGSSGSSGVRFDSLTSLAKMAPDEAETMAYANMKTLMEDTDLSSLFEDMEDELVDATELGISPDSVEHFGIIVVDYEEVNVVGADLDLDTIYAKMAEEGVTSEDYLGFEVWLGGYDMATVLLDDTLMMGSEDGVRACLMAIDSGATAYAGNQHVRDVLDEMADGVITMIMTGDQFYPGSLYAGITVEKLSTENMIMRATMKFADEDEAADIEAEMKASMEETDMFNMTVSRSGCFVEFTADINMEEIGYFW